MYVIKFNGRGESDERGNGTSSISIEIETGIYWQH